MFDERGFLSLQYHGTNFECHYQASGNSYLLTSSWHLIFSDNVLIRSYFVIARSQSLYRLRPYNYNPKNLRHPYCYVFTFIVNFILNKFSKKNIALEIKILQPDGKICLSARHRGKSEEWICSCTGINLDTKLLWVVSLTLRLLVPWEKKPLCPLNRRVCENQN